jgi:hypothetical protein
MMMLEIRVKTSNCGGKIVFSLLLYEAFVVVLAPFVVCCASASSSCVCFWFLRLNPSYRLLFVVFVTSFAPYYLTLFMHLPTCPRISVFLVIFRCIVRLLSQAFGLRYSASEISENSCIPQRNNSNIDMLST